MTGRSILLSGVAAAVALTAVPAPVLAQREIVQPLPPEGTDQLGDALSRLARDTRDVSALLDAGEAALKLNDIDAAIGFFGRAKELEPDNSRVKLGMARAFVRSRRPIEALRLFAEAERAGVSVARMGADRGLAFDLVGDSASAQDMYRLALSQGSDPEITRRLALSQAISGQRDAFEATLLPLLKQGDLSAFRTRAFGLAVLGDEKAAIDIAQARMPAAMATQIAPYLRYMPQLTHAQQAAAGNFGVFPRTASIGIDEPDIAAYTPPRRVAANDAAAQLAPAGTPLGAQAGTTSRTQRKRAERAQKRAEAKTKPTRVAAASPTPTPAPVSAPAPAPIRVPATTAAQVGELAPVLSVPATAAAVQPAPPMAQPAPNASPPSQAAPIPSPQIQTVQDVPAERPVVVARVDQPRIALPQDAPPADTPAPQVEAEPVSLEQAFNSFVITPAAPSAPAQGAVDITKIKIKREVEKPAPPPAKAEPPPPPKIPSRNWVQVATGKNRDALKFDWRRIARSADGQLDGKGPFVTRWVEANRLLAGPYPSAKAAKDMVATLKKLGVDSFTFTSAEGEEIEELQ